MLWTTRLLRALQEMVVLARSILKVLRLRQPGMVFLKVISQGEDGMLKFKLVLPAPGASDVVKRNLVIAVGIEAPVTVELNGAALETAVYQGNDNDAVSGTLVDVDDAGNSSAPRDFSFVLVDTIAPPAPGELGLVVTEEV